MVKHLAKILVVLVLLVTGAVAVFSVRSPGTSSPDLPIQAFDETVTPAPKLPSVTSIVSPNGKMTLKVREEKVEGGVKKTFSALEKESGQTVEIWSKIIQGDATLSVPYNTFSPDNKYIFLVEKDGRGTKYYVLSTGGKDITEGQKFLEVTGPFGSKFPEFTISEITGWGGVGLLVVNTKGVNGEMGASFWFEVPSGGIIRLSSQFN